MTTELLHKSESLGSSLYSGASARGTLHIVYCCGPLLARNALQNGQMVSTYPLPKHESVPANHGAAGGFQADEGEGPGSSFILAVSRKVTSRKRARKINNEAEL